MDLKGKIIEDDDLRCELKDINLKEIGIALEDDPSECSSSEDEENEQYRYFTKDNKQMCFNCGQKGHQKNDCLK